MSDRLPASIHQRGHQARGILRRLGILTADPERLSEELRNSDDTRLGHRRKIVALSFTAAAAMQVVGLYQSGVLRRVPEPDLPLLDADEVDASREAFAFLSVGDAFLGLVSYGVTAALAAAGPVDRPQRLPWLPLALACKATVDSLQAARLTRVQWTKHRAFCSWCLLAAGATFATLPLTWPEARVALRSLRNAGQRPAPASGG
jgi:hypothetical protein